jgi:hypothetical protein
MMPDDHAIVDIWNLVFGQEYGLEDKDVEGETFLVVKALVCAHTITKRTLTTTQVKRAISAWLHRFAESAEKAVAAEFSRQGLSSKDERATFVRSILGSVDDIHDMDRPFLWETAYDTSNPSAKREVTFALWSVLPSQFVIIQGIFQGRLVARTFLEHVQVINSVGEDDRVQERPVGALALAVQAVRVLDLISGLCD